MALSSSGADVAVGIVASAGGPQALIRLCPLLSFTFPVPVFIIQHIHPRFTTLLVTRLRELTGLPVHLAQDGEIVEVGVIYVAPGDQHMQVQKSSQGVRIRLSRGLLRHGVSSSADFLFESMAETYGGGAVAVVLTGMGRDGTEGARRVVSEGGQVLAQAVESCLIPGMVLSLREGDVPHHSVPLSEMGEAIGTAVLRALRGMGYRGGKGRSSASPLTSRGI